MLNKSGCLNVAFPLQHIFDLLNFLTPALSSLYLNKTNNTKIDENISFPCNFNCGFLNNTTDD